MRFTYRALLSFVVLLTFLIVEPNAAGGSVWGLAQDTGSTVMPIWAKPDHFWYRRSVPGGHLWMAVDARHGVREPLFDHQRLAIELSLRTGLEFTPLTLPLADPAAEFVVKYDGSNAYIQEGAMAIEFILDGYLWRCDLQIKWDWNRVPPTDYECLSRRPATPGSGKAAAPAPIVSPDKRWEVLVENHNITVRSVADRTSAPIVKTTDGTADFAWQPGSIQWTRDSQSVSAWRVSAQVWQSADVAGNVTSQIARGEWRVEGK